MCPYCEMKLQYSTVFKNENRSCPICGKYFIMKGDEGNSHLQSQELERKLGYYKESNKNLQFEISKQSILDQLTEQENHRFKDHNQKMERTNEDTEKMLSTKNEEISRLKNRDQDLEDNKKVKK